MEQFIMSLAEKSLVGAGFAFLLYHTVIKGGQINERIASTLDGVASTLNRMDLRLEQLEKRMDELEEK